jgi:hypothetical protein
MSENKIVITTLEDIRVLESSIDESYRQFPEAFKFGNTIFISMSQHLDNYIDHPTDGMLISRDNGATFGEKINQKDFMIVSMIEKDGLIYAFNYINYYQDEHNFLMYYWTTEDLGRNWIKHECQVKTPFTINRVGSSNWSSIVTYHNTIQLHDGSWVFSTYGKTDCSVKYGSYLFRLSPDFSTAEYYSTIAKTDTVGKEGFCEPAVVRTAEDSLLAVMRIGGREPMYCCWSYNDGITWTEPTMLQGVDVNQTLSVAPRMIMLDSGIIALSYGRPNCNIIYSLDGCGYNWTGYTKTYDSPSTGYTALVQLDNDTLLLA